MNNPIHKALQSFLSDFSLEIERYFNLGVGSSHIAFQGLLGEPGLDEVEHDGGDAVDVGHHELVEMLMGLDLVGGDLDDERIHTPVPDRHVFFHDRNQIEVGMDANQLHQLGCIELNQLGFHSSHVVFDHQFPSIYFQGVPYRFHFLVDVLDGVGVGKEAQYLGALTHESVLMTFKHDVSLVVLNNGFTIK